MPRKKKPAIIEQRADDQPAAMEDASIAGTLPEEDRREPEPEPAPQFNPGAIYQDRSGKPLGGGLNEGKANFGAITAEARKTVDTELAKGT